MHYHMQILMNKFQKILQNLAFLFPLTIKLACITSPGGPIAIEVCHEKTDLKVFVVVIPKEGWARVAAPILLLV